MTEFDSKIKAVEQNIKAVEKDLKELRDSLKEFKDMYTREVTPNIKTWDGAADNIKWIGRIVVAAVVMALLALIGLK